MEDTSQQEKQEAEYEDPNEDQGGFRRRLRDRALLRKRKAEAEEKETNQVENQRKRSRASGSQSGTNKRGRPKKKDQFTKQPVTQEEPPFSQEGPAVVVVPEPVETKSPSEPVLGSFQSSVLVPLLSQSALINQTPAPVSPSVPDSARVDLLDTALIEDPTLHVVPIPVVSQDFVPAAAPAPPQVENFYTESQGGEGLDPVLIEDLGPDEEEDVPTKEDKTADEDLKEATMISATEQNKMFSVSGFSSSMPPQEYLPGNSV